MESYGKYDENEFTFEAEEIKDFPAAETEEHYACRYVHAIFGKQNKIFNHFDGAIRSYDFESLTTRVSQTFLEYGRKAGYLKVFRVDGKPPIDKWKTLVTHFYQENPLVYEYFEIDVSGLNGKFGETWLHDLGYLNEKSKDSENGGEEIAEAFLAKDNIDNHLIEGIINTIVTAAAGNRSDNLLVQTLCDADLYYLGTKGFFTKNKLVRKEREWESGEKIPKKEWINKTIAFPESRHFQTTYCQEKLERRKQKNLIKLKNKLQDLDILR